MSSLKEGLKEGFQEVPSMGLFKKAFPEGPSSG
jgi:hypothetical protein